MPESTNSCQCPERNTPPESPPPQKFGFLDHLIGVLLIVIFILIIVQIVMRFVFSNPLSWSEELSRYLLIWITFLGASLAVKQGSHLVVGADITQKLSVKKQHILKLGTYCAVILVVAILGVEGLKLSMNTMGYEAVSFPMPMGFVWLALPVNALLMLYYFIKDAKKLIKNIKSYK